MKKRIFLLLFSIIILYSVGASEYYVYPSANSSGNGSITNPWELQYALNGANGTVIAGDTIYLRNGTYGGPFTSTLAGNSTSPIVVRSFPGEWATIDDSFETTIIQDVLANGTNTICRFNNAHDYPLGYTMKIGNNTYYLSARLSLYTHDSSDDNAYTCFTDNLYKPFQNYSNGTRAIILGSIIEHTGNYTHFRDFEITSVRDNRFPYNGEKGSGLNFESTGTGNKAINLIIHDVGHPAIGFWGQEDQGEIYGCVVWGNGIYDMYDNKYPSGYTLVADNTTQSLKIYNVSITPLADDLMKMEWYTNSPSTSQVFYGIYHNDTEIINFSLNNTLDSTPSTHHQSIIELTSSSHWYEVFSTNATDNVTAIGSFRSPWIRGNAIYSQNVNETVTISDVITFNHFTTGAKCHGEGGYCNGFTFVGNIAFDNPETGLAITTSINPVNDVKFISNQLYNNDLGAGYVAEDNQNITVYDNYIAYNAMNDNGPLEIKEYHHLNITSNIIYNYGNISDTITGGIIQFHMPTAFSYLNAYWDYNRYYGGRWFADQNDPRLLTKADWLISAYGAPGWINFSTYNEWEVHSTYNQTGVPPDRVVIRKNKYESGRANIVVWNWENKTKVNISLLDAGIEFGDSYKIWDVQNYPVTILNGTYLGGQIEIPLNLTTKRAITGNITHYSVSSHTPQEFNVFVIEKTSSRNEWYVSVDGNNASFGSRDDPWDIQYALNGADGNITSGDIIYIMNGTYHAPNITGYNLTWTVNLRGNSSSEIYIKNFNNTRVTLDGNLNLGSSTNISIIGLEITDSLKMSRDDPWDPISGGNSNIKFINNIIHDVGICLSNGGVQEAYGNLLYYCGKSGLDHGIYWQNNFTNLGKYKIIKDNLIGNTFGMGIHLYGQLGLLDGFMIEGNTLWNSGSLSDYSEARNILIGGYNPVNRTLVKENIIYNSEHDEGTGIQLGYNNNANANISLVSNYIANREPISLNQPFIKMNIFNNTLIGTYRFAYSLDGYNVSDIFPYGPYLIYNNTIYTPISSGYGPFYMHLSNTNYNLTEWQNISGFENNSAEFKGLPSQNKIFIKQNQYDSSRYNVIIFNWENLSSIKINVSNILQDGDYYELHNTADYFSDVDSGRYLQGDNLTINMTGRTIAKPLGFNKPNSTFPEFGAFILIKTDYLYQTDSSSNNEESIDNSGGGGSGGGGGGGGGGLAGQKSQNDTYINNAQNTNETNKVTPVDSSMETPLKKIKESFLKSKIMLFTLFIGVIVIFFTSIAIYFVIVAKHLIKRK